MSTTVAKKVKVRFAPSPTGDLHVGNIRTALFDWAYARHTGGTFLFRIEDTDTTRVTDEYINAAIDTLKWLGLDWDEGPEVGGENGPYLQSQRLDIYAHWAAKFIEQKDAYHCYCTPEELEAVREAQRAANVAPGYNGHCRDLTADQIAEYKGLGRGAVVRMRMPDGSTTFNDLIRGEMAFDHKFVPDFVMVRADGSPLYTLAVAVDDVLMKVTHVLRGEDLLSSTPRQIRVYQAMGLAIEDYPVFAHLPFVMGADNAKLSKRNGEVSIAWYRDKGFLPEAICNYLALLGWSPGEDRENVTMKELCELFTVEKVNSSPARFDMKKLEAINGDKIRALTIDEFLTWALPFLIKAGVITGAPEEIALVKRALPIIQERIIMFSEVPAMLNFLFVKNFEVATDSLSKVIDSAAKEVLKRALKELEPISDWTHSSIEAALRASLIDEMGLKPRIAFGAVRIATTGSTISPPLFESMELLGKEASLARISGALTL
ncbi:MAG: glutamate--tRNA ligase [Actinobacteria bacterium]|uniref:glutamate--tRNA ligase n=1 Tax=freshwater metagenome TaxID=449393 RepID=A0A6J7LQP4_9ZZZZ|nr:glutamate--tRNA ligase [Actinomycetota bacterium]MSW62178.1 glutamate--tRNA ligase [Actinomycetota bacterium]MTA58556.1 glutamate--tRNA ligase [Actinomycetota bacterium]